MWFCSSDCVQPRVLILNVKACNLLLYMRYWCWSVEHCTREEILLYTPVKFCLYRFPWCHTVCPQGMYGSNCSQTCQCQNGAACNAVDGSCTCRPSYHGPLCDQGKDKLHAAHEDGNLTGYHRVFSGHSMGHTHPVYRLSTETETTIRC